MIVDAELRRSRPAHGLPHQNRCGGVVVPSRQFRRSMPAAFGAEARRPPHQTAEIADGRRHNCNRGAVVLAARTPPAPSRGPDCPTPIIPRKIFKYPSDSRTLSRTRSTHASQQFRGVDHQRFRKCHRHLCRINLPHLPDSTTRTRAGSACPHQSGGTANSAGAGSGRGRRLSRLFRFGLGVLPVPLPVPLRGGWRRRWTRLLGHIRKVLNLLFWQ